MEIIILKHKQENNISKLQKNTTKEKRNYNKSNYEWKLDNIKTYNKPIEIKEKSNW